MSYNDTNCGHTGWGVGLSAIIGGALGYWAGRSSGPGGLEGVEVTASRQGML